MRRVIAKDKKKEFCCCFLTSFTADTKIWYNFVFLAKDTATNRVWIMFEHVQIVWVIDSHTPMIQRSKRYCDAALMLGKSKSFSWCLEMCSSVRMVLQKARASRCSFELGEKEQDLLILRCMLLSFRKIVQQSKGIEMHIWCGEKGDYPLISWYVLLSFMPTWTYGWSSWSTIQQGTVRYCLQILRIFQVWVPVTVFLELGIRDFIKRNVHDIWQY